MKIREIQPEDNKVVAQLIRSVFDELNIPKTGTAYEDVSLDKMYETYQLPRSNYFVVMSEGVIVGGAGVAPLQNDSSDICELQKMYFLREARGKGAGFNIMELCLKAAKDFGFEKCYLETMPFMEEAQKLYKKFNFKYLETPMGCTGHTSCPVWMIKDL
ncbi:N-acetyltransferase [Neptunitalea chrysea]|uniref:N-acetyltransferase n=1 Tax=Neptunitalea chrysea TaxID=1647581 RepID=A0A9W6ET61_9FLAO|nr:GNAT family N-acetyltransferase [Neptunitalea chrysea]GLB51200.1 N-acetyltransferase [Neptunitalea chrysea]